MDVVPRATPEMWAELDPVIRNMECHLQTLQAVQSRLLGLRTSLQLQRLFPLLTVLPVQVELIQRALRTLEEVDLAITQGGRDWRCNHRNCGSNLIVGQWYCALKRQLVSNEREGCSLLSQFFPDDGTPGSGNEAPMTPAIPRIRHVCNTGQGDFVLRRKLNPDVSVPLKEC